MRPVALLCLLAAATGCGRPLAPSEETFLVEVLGPKLDTDGVRIHDGALIGNIPMTRPPRPWKACRERIFPPETEPEIETSIFGFVLGSHMFIARKYFAEDFLEGYPDTLPLASAMIIAHEMTHVWQWQNRDLTGYAPWRAAGEHAMSEDPYLFDIGDREFLDYPYEQQASIVEEFVCCSALDPEGTRTARLHDLLSPAFPDLPRQSKAGKVALPWEGVTTDGICG